MCQQNYQAFTCHLLIHLFIYLSHFSKLMGNNYLSPKTDLSLGSNSEVAKSFAKYLMKKLKLPPQNAPVAKKNNQISTNLARKSLIWQH